MLLRPAIVAGEHNRRNDYDTTGRKAGPSRGITPEQDLGR
jgi:hypothetical protein